MIAQGQLEFNLILVHDYIYSMKVVMSTLFQVMHFSHNGNIVTIDQISFINNCTTFSEPISLSVPNVHVVYPPPQVYYVATHLIKPISY